MSRSDSHHQLTFSRNPTRAVKVGTVVIGGGHPVVVQSMCATRTVDMPSTVAPGRPSWPPREPGAVRIAVDSTPDARDWPEIRGGPRRTCRSIRRRTTAVADVVAPWVDKIRYNPGHLYHHERQRPWRIRCDFSSTCRRRTTSHFEWESIADQSTRASVSNSRPVIGSVRCSSVRWNTVASGSAGLYTVLCFAQGL